MVRHHDGLVAELLEETLREAQELRCIVEMMRKTAEKLRNVDAETAEQMEVLDTSSDDLQAFSSQLQLVCDNLRQRFGGEMLESNKFPHKLNSLINMLRRRTDQGSRSHRRPITAPTIYTTNARLYLLKRRELSTQQKVKRLGCGASTMEIVPDEREEFTASERKFLAAIENDEIETLKIGGEDEETADVEGEGEGEGEGEWI